MSSPKDVVLGFYEKAKSSLILTPEFTPSKVGGSPVSSFFYSQILYRPGSHLWANPRSGAISASTSFRF